MHNLNSDYILFGCQQNILNGEKQVKKKNTCENHLVPFFEFTVKKLWFYQRNGESSLIKIVHILLIRVWYLYE